MNPFIDMNRIRSLLAMQQQQPQQMGAPSLLGGMQMPQMMPQPPRMSMDQNQAGGGGVGGGINILDPGDNQNHGGGGKGDGGGGGKGDGDGNGGKKDWTKKGQEYIDWSFPEYTQKWAFQPPKPYYPLAKPKK
jgi:hypothetical protein